MTAPAQQQFLVLSALGPDRPGLVADVTRHLTSRGANVEESRMAILGAEFGLMLLVSGDEAELARVEAELPELETKSGLRVITRRTRAPGEHRRGPTRPYVIEVESIDREGILHAVAGAVHEMGVNIVSLETTAFEAPFTGGVLFRLEARIDVPQTVPVSRLRDTMEALGERENLDIEVRPLAAKS
jgi:glycine cleavage system transcriptional repressor